ncbi:unnamed protein product, partial [Prorocentrum cordatum]
RAVAQAILAKVCQGTQAFRWEAHMGVPRAGEEELFDFVWSSIEKEPRVRNVSDELSLCESSSASAAAPSRRRLRGKQPAAHSGTITLVCVTCRRLVGKQPPPQLPAGAGGRARRAAGGRAAGAPIRGHYDRLGLRRSASAAEVRAAYRQLALATHPDKGGDSRLFLEITAAFEELSDEGRRAAYDRSLDLFSSGDGTFEGPPGGLGGAAPAAGAGVAGRRQAQYGAARIILEALLRPAGAGSAVAEAKAWAEQLQALPGAVLEALCDLVLCGGAAGSPGDGGSGACQPPHGRGSASQGGATRRARAPAVSAGCSGGRPRCIHWQKGSGYSVHVSWAGLSVSTPGTPSLAQALDWQIALAAAQGAAQAWPLRGEPAFQEQNIQRQIVVCVAKGFCARRG